MKILQEAFRPEEMFGHRNPGQGIDFQGPDDPDPVVLPDFLSISWVHGLQLFPEHFEAGFRGFPLKLPSDGFIFAGPGEEPVEERLEVEASPPGDEGDIFSLMDRVDRVQGLGREVGRGELGEARDDIQKMVGDLLPVFQRGFVGADIEAPIDLHRVTVDDLAADGSGQVYGRSAFSDAGRADDEDQMFDVRSQF